MFARVTVQFGVREKALVVPEEAIVPQGTRQFVIKLDDGGENGVKLSRRVEVRVGIRRPGRVEILEGLKAGEVVVTAGQQRLQRDGTPVQAIELAIAGAGEGVNVATAGATPGGGRAAAVALAATRKAAPVLVTGENPCMAMARS